MPKLRLALEPGGPKRLEISWQRGWTDFRVLFDGKELGAVGVDSLKQGCELAMPDDSKLSVRLASGFGFGQLQVLRNGKPVPGSPTDPGLMLQWSVWVIFVIGVLAIAQGLAATMDSEVSGPMGAVVLVTGFVFVGLGFWARQKSIVALGAAAGLVSLVIALKLLGLFALLANGEMSALGFVNVILNGAFLYLILKGFGAVRKMREEKAQARSAPA